MKRALLCSVLYGVGMTCVVGYQAYTQWSLMQLVQRAAATDVEATSESWLMIDPVRSSADPPLLRQHIHVVRAAEVLAACGAIPLPTDAKIVKIECPAPVWARVVLDNGKYFVYDFIGFTPPGRLPTIAAFEKKLLPLSLVGRRKDMMSQASAVFWALGKESKMPDRLYCSFRTNERPLLCIRDATPSGGLYGIHTDAMMAEWVQSSEYPPPPDVVVKTAEGP